MFRRLKVIRLRMFAKAAIRSRGSYAALFAGAFVIRGELFIVRTDGAIIRVNHNGSEHHSEWTFDYVTQL